MKLIILCLFGSAVAELPRFRPARFRLQRQELAPTTDSATEATTETGPYPPSGWKPAEAFTLPEQTEAPSTETNGPYPPSGWTPDQPFTLPNEPSTNYGTPENTYGPPVEVATDSPKAEKLEEIDVQKSIGTYFVVLPNGQLQRVEFLTEDDVQNLKYSARLQLRDRAPLYVFGP